ncbi:MAG: sigma factor-like helix-turn-helix DNA-binding protein, partial [Candidatus Anammoxibacter sp.]
KDYLLIARLKNNRIARRVKDAGYRNFRQLCNAKGVSYCGALNMLNMKMPAINLTGEWKKVAVDLSEALGCLPGDLFSDYQKILPEPMKVVEKELSYKDINMLIEPPQNLAMLELRTDLGNTLRGLLEMLTEREGDIIKRRHGMDDYTEQTFNVIAQHYKISIERTRQIYRKSLRRLKHPARSDNLKEYIEDIHKAEINGQ